MGDISMTISTKEIKVDLSGASDEERESFDKSLGRTKCTRRGNKITIKSRNPEKKALQILKAQKIEKRLNFKISDNKVELIKGEIDFKTVDKIVSAPKHVGGC